MHKIKLYPTWHFLLVKSIGLWPVPLNVLIYNWNPNAVKTSIWWVSAAAFLFTAWQNRKIFLGGPVFEFSESGIAESGAEFLPWNLVTSVNEYQNPSVLEIVAPFRKPLPASRIFPKKWVRQERRLLLYSRKVRGPLDQVRSLVSSRYSVRKVVDAPEVIRTAIKNLL